MPNIFGATSTTDDVLSGTDLRGKRILGLTTPFGFHSTATEVAAGVDLTGKRVIVTGGAAGIGIETVRSLALAGAEITLAVRRPDAARPVAEELRKATGNAALEVRPLDLSDLRSVQSFVDDWTGPLHILVNNAGIMAVPELKKTPQGFELQFGTNYLGHFALTLGLHRALAAVNGARVVSVSSIAHLFSPVIFDDLGFDFVPYTPFGAYGQSKSAAMLLSVGITRKWAEDGILSNSLNPGAIATGLQKHTGGLKTPVERRKTPELGHFSLVRVVGIQHQLSHPTYAKFISRWTRSSERNNRTLYGKDSRTSGPARKTSVETPNLRRFCENAQLCCRLPCEEHFSCVSWMVSQSLRQPESWECHTERSRRSWHAHEQKSRGTCGQCLPQVVVDPNRGTSTCLRATATRGHPTLPNDLKRDLMEHGLKFMLEHAIEEPDKFGLLRATTQLHEPREHARLEVMSWTSWSMPQLGSTR
jgi:NAD(P)-dependent dehydrogenase (short-subunit alcohol dehydrogenase family)